MEEETGCRFSMQAELIRQIQEEQGMVPCYATPSAENCDQKKEGACRWRHDCFNEAEMGKNRRGG